MGILAEMEATRSKNFCCSKSFKNTASQGQRKSLLFALKLAEFELLKANKGFAPLLFLDDVFDEKYQ